MTESSIEAPRSVRRERRRRGWTDGFTIEDLILYVFGAVILALFWVMFAQVQSHEKSPSDITTTAMASWQPATSDILPLTHIKAQLASDAMRYEQAMRTSASISTRLDFGFLVGTILALLGSLIAIRGSRGENIDADMKASEYVRLKVTTTSSGAFIALLGAAIILATVLNNDHAFVEDKGITLAPVEVYAVPQSTDVTATAGNQSTNDSSGLSSLAEKLRKTRPKTK